jgi:hypothetical protein
MIAKVDGPQISSANRKSANLRNYKNCLTLYLPLCGNLRILISGPNLFAICQFFNLRIQFFVRTLKLSQIPKNMNFFLTNISLQCSNLNLCQNIAPNKAAAEI